MAKDYEHGLDLVQRQELTSKIKQLRLAAGMDQQELANLAGVSRTTLSNLESGRTRAPQERVLRRVLEVLGVDLSTPKFDEQTELWLTIVGTMLESIPAERRQAAADRAIHSLSMDMRAGQSPVVDELERRRKATNVGRPTEDEADLAGMDEDELARRFRTAANTDTSQDDLDPETHGV